MSSSPARLAKITLALAAACAAQSTTAAVYDPTAEFSVTNGNPNGVWSYGYSLDPDVADFSATFVALPQAISGAGGHQFESWSLDANGPHVSLALLPNIYQVEPGQIALHPGPPEIGTPPAILRFTAPADLGMMTVSGAFLPGDTGLIDLGIAHNGVYVWTALDAGTFDLTFAIANGDTVDFIAWGTWGFGNTPLVATIATPAPVPEPASSAALAGAALLGLAAIRRRRRA